MTLFCQSSIDSFKKLICRPPCPPEPRRCPPWYLGVTVWVPYALIFMSVMSAVFYTLLSTTIINNNSSSIPQDYGFVSLKSGTADSPIPLVPNVNTQIQFTNAATNRPGYINHSSTSNAAKFGIIGIPPGKPRGLMFYTPQFTVANGMKVKVSGTVDSTMLISSSSPLATTVVCGFAWIDTTLHVITEANQLINGTIPPSTLDFSLPYAITFLPSMIPASGFVTLALFIRNDDPAVTISYSLVDISFTAVEIT